MSAIADYIARDFGTFAELVALQSAARPDGVAVIDETAQVTYAELNARADRLAASLQRDGVAVGDVVAICASASIDYVVVLLGTLRAGAAISPVSPSATPQQLCVMIHDSGATHLFTDGEVSRHLREVADQIGARRIALCTGATGEPLAEWLAPEGSRPQPVGVDPDGAFNIIYSSGTTGTPKGIVQSHRMRWPHVHRADPPGYGPGAVAIISTPLYSNTTLVSLIPALGGGGTAVLMAKFDARRFLELSERHRVNFAMLVPVQYRRILDLPDFDTFDLSSYYMKYATSAPFPADLKAEVLRRWPGGLIEYYGMTEGGGSCMLIAHEHPDKLATVGKPMPGHEMRVVDEAGNQLPPGAIGEVVGRSPSMMNGYHNQPEKTAEAEWWSPEGERFIRTGDIASVDEDGFFTLIGRVKDMIISGGINIYPVDLESVLISHPAVREAAVIGAASERWGETPVGIVTVEPGAAVEPTVLCDWANAQLGKMQRLSSVMIVDELPRNPIGKTLKRELQEWYAKERAA
ncbi:class I adenylate-forming enzyme family protein [Sphingomonas sp.]|uniref:class I adenylate-forming enzyme family protein n=1 Tax=Sphingomonas sp. TaxID=28214 RepID=UPI002604EE16|nr:class I adenylate-forming enzyme family protein [Sphingomonas sp.]MDF2496301.1 4-coumarate--CoA ligase [Sphingomonas sp.]